MNCPFPPEGRLLHTRLNQALTATPAGLRRAMEQQLPVEGTALFCHSDHSLVVALGPYQVRIPREEAALGIADGSTRDIAILSRVGKSVTALVTGFSEEDGILCPILSRRAAQEKARDYLLSSLASGDVIPATVTHLESFGVFVDIGCGLSSMIGVEAISVSRIPHPSARFSIGQEIFAAVLDTDLSTGRVYLTHRELLGTWAENCAPFAPGMTVPGIVRGIKEYGTFIELTPNLSGLAEHKLELSEGDRVSVFIKSILPERMKIKLAVIDRLPALPGPTPFSYYIQEGRLERWRYAPPNCHKLGAETIFGG